MELDKKIKELKIFIKEKTDQGTANYLGKEIREICGMVESIKLRSEDTSSPEYYLVELRKLNQLNQTQISLNEQLKLLRPFANKLGLYDAADYINKN